MAHSGTMRLFSGPLSMFGAKVQIAALEKGPMDEGEMEWMKKSRADSR